MKNTTAAVIAPSHLRGAMGRATGCSGETHLGLQDLDVSSVKQACRVLPSSARERGVDDTAALAFHVNKIPISAAIEVRGAQEMVALVLRRRSGPIRARHAHTGGNRRWTC